MDSIRFLSIADVIALHEDAMSMADQSPAALVRPESLESALAQVRQRAWYAAESVPALAAHLAAHVALAHPWVDGNKRTASYAALQFLWLNGARDLEAAEFIDFGDHLLRFIEADQADRGSRLNDLVALVETWFDAE